MGKASGKHARNSVGKQRQKKRTGGDRRTVGARRRDSSKASRDALHEYHADGASVNHFLTRNWSFLAIVAAGILALSIWQAGSLPSLPVAVMLLLGIVAAAGGNWLATLERKSPRSSLVAAVFLTFGIGLPILTISSGLTLWTVGGDMSPSEAACGLALVSAVCAMLLRQKLISLIVALVCCWAPFATVLEPLFGLALLVIAGGLTFRIVQIQSSEQEKAQQAMEQANRARYRAEDILNDYEDTGQSWFWETDRRGQLTYLSSRIPQLLGIAEENVLGRHLTSLFDLTEAAREGERTLTFHLSARSAFNELPLRAGITHEDRWWSVSGKPIYDSFDNFLGFRGWGMDLTEKKRSQEQASRLAHYDSLTGLANRHQMSQTLEKILSSQADVQRECAIYLLDLDRFKQVNDTLGHPAGDALLKQVAQRLERTIGDAGRVGRLGGDEFQVILHGKADAEALAHLAQDVIFQLSQPYSIEGHNVIIGASVGIAVSPEHGKTSEELIRNADLALYAAKDGGRGRYHFYADDLHSEAEERRQLEHDLRDALANGGLNLVYQPVVDTATERIAGFEALLRWNHPVQGPLSPDKFIPIAEDANLIIPIGEWALRTACHDLANWPEEVRVAVNVSPLQFANAELPTVVTNALAQAGVTPSRLELEITESVFLNDDEGTDTMFRRLKAIGVRLALDDFGTGYSSLGYLKKAPFDKIKIDQSFVRGATQPSSRNGAIIASITSLAHALGMDTTAEGVETLDELDLVRMYGCSHVQGYIYEKPLTAEQALSRLQTGLLAVASGPRSARSPRQTMLRKIELKHGSESYVGTIRNISVGGALVEGLWNVPAGTEFTIALSESVTVSATCRWCKQGRMGIEFSKPLRRDSVGRIVEIQEDPVALDRKPLLRKSA